MESSEQYQQVDFGHFAGQSPILEPVPSYCARRPPSANIVQDKPFPEAQSFSPAGAQFSTVAALPRRFKRRQRAD